MNRFVLDASVAVSWVGGRPADLYAVAMQLRVQSGWRAIVPCLWPLEVANGFLLIERRRALTAADVDRGLSDLEAFLATKAEVEQTPAPMRRLGNLARSHQLTVYDAAYLELAQRQGLPIATLDKSLRAAAASAGVALVK